MHLHSNSTDSADNEFRQYWPLLTRQQKETVLTIIKSFTRPDQQFVTDQYSEELKQALQRVQSGEYYTEDQVKEILRRRR